MNSWIYVAVPFVAWLIAGFLKFIINSFKNKRVAVDLVGYGGMPSNHSSIVSSVATLIGCTEGVDSPVFGLAITLVFIVIMDANGLRRAVGRHAAVINQLSGGGVVLRELMGHTKLEIMAGLFLGMLIGFLSASIGF